MVGKMNILNASGHTEVAYDTDKPETLVEAKGLFDAHIAKGGAAFDGTGQRVKTWDPTTAEVLPEQLTLIAPLQGG